MSDKVEATPAPELATVHTDREGAVENTTTNRTKNIDNSDVNISAGNIGGSAIGDTMSRAGAAGTEEATVHTDNHGKVENRTVNDVGNIDNSKVNISSGNIGGSVIQK